MLRAFLLRVFSLSMVLTTTVLLGAPHPQLFHHPLVFEPNRGQAPSQVKWIGRASGYQLLLTGDGATIVLPEYPAEVSQENPVPVFLQPTKPPASPSKMAYSMLRIKLTGSRAWDEVKGLEPTGGTSNYFLGKDPKDWHTDIPQYARVSAAGVYDGIDLVFYSHGNDLEYDFVVAPGADPKQIQLAFEGADRMRIDGKSGDLLLTTARGSELRHIRPRVYQQVGDRKIEVAGGYQLLDHRQAAFALGAYDRQCPLVIDPTVSFTTFLAGNDWDLAGGMALDNSGNVYVTGSTSSTNYPVIGPIPPGFDTYQRAGDAFVTKLDPSGAIVFSAYLGGYQGDYGSAIAVDSTGVYIVGTTQSRGFPTYNAIFPNLHNEPNWDQDAFVTKISPTGNTLIYSTFLGGSGYESGGAIAVDSAHAAYVVGTTYQSPDFPVAGAGRSTLNGYQDAFLTKIDPSGTQLLYSGYLGGSGGDWGSGVALDQQGNPYILISTCSTDLPVSPGRQPYPGGCSAFLMGLDSPGENRFSTYLGGGDDWGGGIVMDANSNVYVVGSTRSQHFPVAYDAYQPYKPSSRAERYSGFVMKLTPFGFRSYSTYFGGWDKTRICLGSQ